MKHYLIEEMLVDYIDWRIRAVNDLCDLTKQEREQFVETASNEFVDARDQVLAES